ncbi:MAG: hypothetical protein N3C60_03305 [Calditerrivibrio sp.]|nr:hypothetical protein [Calditerrivibrio sp.]
MIKRFDKKATWGRKKFNAYSKKEKISKNTLLIKIEGEDPLDITC